MPSPSSPLKDHPLLSRKEFIKILKFMETQDKKFDAFSTVAGNLCPGFYVDFYPNCEYNTVIIKLLNAIFNCPNGSDSPIEYYIYEVVNPISRNLDALNNEEVLDDIPPEFSSPSKLYDYLLTLQPDHPEGGN